MAKNEFRGEFPGAVIMQVGMFAGGIEARLLGLSGGRKQRPPQTGRHHKVAFEIGRAHV